MPNATVAIDSIGRTVSTDRNGVYNIPNIAAGTYNVTIRYLGYEDTNQSVSVGDMGATRADFEIGYGDVVKLENFVVEGIREGQARALQQKRNAENIMDIVSADAVGKFPDGNAAESLRRMPGISVEIDQDEGRYVVIRGIDSALNNVTLNNQVLGTPSEQGNRGVAMDSVPADLISRLEVSKAVTPDLDGTAIGGAINIVTKSAFETEGQFLYGSIAGFYDSFSKRYSPNGSLTWGRTLGADRKWGVVTAASYSKKRFQSQTSDNIDWTLINNILAPTTQESFNYDIMRERIGVNVALEHRPNEDSEYALRFNHNEFTDEEGRQKFGYNFIPGQQYVTNQTATSGTVSRGRSTREFRSYHQTGTIRAASLSGKHKLASDYELSWQVGGSRGERDVPKRDDWEYRSSATAFPNTYDLSGESAIVTPTANFYSASAYPFRRVRFRHDLEQEDVLSAQIDLRRDVEWGTKQGYWKVGAKFVSREKEDDRENENYNLASGSANSFTLAQPGLAGVYSDSLINREPAYYFRGRFPFGPTIHLENNEAFFAANPSRFTYDAAGSLDNSVGGDYRASEDVLAAYGMGSVQLTPKVTLLGGVRVEQTKGDYVANYDNDGTWIVDGSTGSIEYTTVMPGVHLVWRANDKMVVRFAWTNTLGRPSYSLLAPIKVFESDEILDEDDEPTGTFSGGLEMGNPELKPYESMNFDLSWEYYLPNAGILSVGAFHKSIDNPVYDNSSTFSDYTFEGQTYRSFTINRPENADSGKVTGVEFNYQQFFTFLPSPLDGLGVNLNYTITNSSATLLINPRDVPFFKQADKIGNFSIVYEKYGWEARVSVAYNGPYITSISNVTMIGTVPVNPADFDIYNDSRTVVDAKVSYRINEHFTVFGELININEEPLKEYTGIPSRNTGNEIYDWKARFGVNFSL